jgi:glycine cleavage system aminomethyltransferase T
MAVTPILGAFAIACTVQDAAPLLGVPVGEPYALSFIARGGAGTMTGGVRLKGQQRIALVRANDGTMILKGLTFRDGGQDAWAALTPSASKDEYEMSWLMYDHVARDGRSSVAVWAKGHCKRMGPAKEDIQ